MGEIIFTQKPFGQIMIPKLDTWSPMRWYITYLFSNDLEDAELVLGEERPPGNPISGKRPRLWHRGTLSSGRCQVSYSK